MKYRWIGKNINLRYLAEAAENFFKERDFNTTLDESSDTYEINVVQRKNSDIRRVTIRVYGKAEDFIVEFTAGEEAGSFLKLSFLTSLFGGGALALKSQRTVEFYRKLEDEFWTRMTEAVASTVHSNK